MQTLEFIIGMQIMLQKFWITHMYDMDTWTDDVM